MDSKSQHSEQAAVKRINSRTRTSILHKSEMAVIKYLCRKMPHWVNSDMLTAVGMVGSIMTAASVCMVVYFHNRYFFLLAAFFLAVQWFGDSLDGRIAYYRNKPRRWYGWALDMNLDWISMSMLCVAYYFYFQTLNHSYGIIALILAVANAHAYIMVNMKYKIGGDYVIDTGGLLGPTELRIVVALATVTEIFIPKFLIYFCILLTVALLFINLKDFRLILKMGNDRDAEDKKAKMQQGEIVDVTTKHDRS